MDKATKVFFIVKKLRLDCLKPFNLKKLKLHQIDSCRLRRNLAWAILNILSTNPMSEKHYPQDLLLLRYVEPN